MKHRDTYIGGICLITDRRSCSLSAAEMAHIALRAGIRWIQLRDKERSRMSLYRTALCLRKLTRDFGACLVINDYADIAAAVDADGVHIGQEDLPHEEARKVMGEGKIIGISAHNLDEALKAESEGADYVGFGPVLPTETKEAGSPRGMKMLEKVAGRVGIPVVAIGGINANNIDSVMSAGARAVAVATGILRGDACYNAGNIVERVRGCLS